MQKALIGLVSGFCKILRSFSGVLAKDCGAGDLRFLKIPFITMI
jgi:hypothetical protein